MSPRAAAIGLYLSTKNIIFQEKIPMDPITKLNIILALNIALTVCLLYATYYSAFPRSRKTTMYVLSFLAPVVALIVYLVYRRDTKSSAA